MVLTSVTFTALAAALSMIANAIPVRRLAVRDTTGPSIQDQYIVKLKSDVNTARHISSLPFAFSIDSLVTHTWSDDFFKGYGGTFTGVDLDAILASPDVEYVEKNQIFTISDQETEAPWHLQADSTQTTVGSADATSMSFTYSYSQPAGDGVDIYILDTGVYTNHSEFEGRATFPYAAGVYMRVDGHGHGTHCAGTAAGKTYGVAKNANIIGIKVLADNGQGSTTDIVDGLNWVMNNTKSTGRPSVASMSLGGSASQALDDAVSALIASGVQVAAAAGNEAQDAQNTSPAHVPEVLTVAASDIHDAMAPFSNFGAVVDVFAPGVNITSAWIGNPYSTRMVSGTSMATPQVAGLAAYFLSKDTTLTPADIASKVKSLATQNAITGVPSGTVNVLIYNGGADNSTSQSETPAVQNPANATLTDPPTSTESDVAPSPTSSDPEADPSSTDSDPDAEPSSTDTDANPAPSPTSSDPNEN